MNPRPPAPKAGALRKLSYIQTTWWLRRISRPRHSRLQRDALPSELRSQSLVDRIGIEPICHPLCRRGKHPKHFHGPQSWREGRESNPLKRDPQSRAAPFGFSPHVLNPYVGAGRSNRNPRRGGLQNHPSDLPAHIHPRRAKRRSPSESAYKYRPHSFTSNPIDRRMNLPV